MKRWPLVGLALAGLWLFVRGVPLEGIRLVEEGLIGLSVGIPLAYLLRRFYNESFDVPRAVLAVPAAVVYLVLFLKELLTANLDVAYRVLHPRMPIEPDVLEVPLRVRSDLAVTTIANSITLTPGTLSMDYDEERNALYVHAITSREEDAVVAPIRRWEDYALRIFAEPRDPSDPVPDPDAVAAKSESVSEREPEEPDSEAESRPAERETDSDADTGGPVDTGGEDDGE